MYTVQVVRLISNGVQFTKELKLYFEDEIENPPQHLAIVNIYKDQICILSIDICIKEGYNGVFLAEINNKELNELVLREVSYYGFINGVKYIISKEKLPNFKQDSNLFYKKIEKEQQLYKHMIIVYSLLDENYSDYKLILDKVRIKFKNICTKFKCIIDNSLILQDFKETISQQL